MRNTLGRPQGVYLRHVLTYNHIKMRTSGGIAVNTKLTLRLDDNLIRSAKRHSTESGKSVSRLVSDYFALIDAKEPRAATELTPRVRALLGSLSGASVGEQDYRRHLEDKHR